VAVYHAAVDESEDGPKDLRTLSRLTRARKWLPALSPVDRYSSRLKLILVDVQSSTAGAELGFSVRTLEDDLDGDKFHDFVVGSPKFVNSMGTETVLVGSILYQGGLGNVEVWTTAVASSNNHGAAWPGTAGVPSFTARNDPLVGQSLKSIGRRGAQAWHPDGSGPFHPAGGAASHR
jgi:hypothetical protein